MILLVGGPDMGPHVLAEPVRVGQTITVGVTQTCSLRSVLREIVRSVPHIHSNLTEYMVLLFVVENHALDVVEKLFHDRTSKHVKCFTL